MLKQKVWFITGASKGMGVALVELLLANDDKVIATSRMTTNFEDKIINNPNFLPIQINDIANSAEVNMAVDEAITKFGTIDVLVNNAGYGQVGIFEEISVQKVQENFAVNVFGLMNVTRAVLPVMRNKRSGVIFNISSIGGYIGFPYTSVYTATKFAVAGFTEALAKEVEPFDIKVISVLPGAFRTEFFTAASLSNGDIEIDDYTTQRLESNKMWNQGNGTQPNDPTKGMQVLIDLVNSEEKPNRVFLGAGLSDIIKNKNDEISKEVTKWASITENTLFE